MILKALTLENFKGIREAMRIEFAPLTLLFGPNSVGKSTILQALRFTAALLEARGRDPFDVAAAQGMDLGGCQDVVNGRDVTKAIKLVYEIAMPCVFPNYDTEGVFDNLELAWESFGPLAGITESVAGSFRNATIHLELRINPETGDAYLAEYRVDLDDIPFGIVSYECANGLAEIRFINYCHPVLIEVDPQYDSFEAWLDSWGGSEDKDLSEVWGTESNTKLEHYIQQHNKHPFRDKPFPIRIREQRGALGNVRSPLDLDLELEDAKSNWNGATVTHLAASCILSDGLTGPAVILSAILNNGVFLGPLRHIPTRDQAEITGGRSRMRQPGMRRGAISCTLARNSYLSSIPGCRIPTSSPRSTGFKFSVIGRCQSPSRTPIWRIRRLLLERHMISFA